MSARALLRRLIAWLLTILFVHATAFLLVRSARGGPFDTERELPPAVERALQARYHLDESLALQYLRSLSGLLQADFGPSMRYRDVSVGELLRQGLPVSLAIGGGALLLALMLGIPAGLWAANRAGRAADQFVLASTSVALAIPNFVLAGVAILVFSFGLAWLPPAGVGAARHLILPCICLGLPFAAQIARLARTGAREAQTAACVRTAHAKGLASTQILRRHVLPRALVPVVAYFGPAAAGLLTGSLVIEQVFALPGIGTHFVQAALNRDYTLALGVTVVYTALLGGFSLMADLILLRLDPKLEALG